MTRPSSAIAALCAALFVCVAGVGCRARPVADYNGLGAALIQEGRWDEASAMFKGRLIREPRDIAAHFNLGRCYLNGSVFYPLAAEGEFVLALQLFEQGGRHSPVAEYSDQYFELRCHLELAKVYLRLYENVSSGRGAAGARHALANKINATLQKARSIDPQSEDVRTLEAIVKAL